MALVGGKEYLSLAIRLLLKHPKPVEPGDVVFCQDDKKLWRAAETHKGGISSSVGNGQKAIKTEKDASPVGGLKNKDGHILDFWVEAYGKALKDRPNALKLVTDQIAGMAVDDAEVNLRTATKNNTWFHSLTQREAAIEWSLDKGIINFGDEWIGAIHGVGEKLMRGLQNAATWRDPDIHTARESLDIIRRNKDLTIKMVEAKVKVG